MNPLILTQQIQALLSVIQVTHPSSKTTATAIPSQERLLSLLKLEYDLLSKLADTLSSMEEEDVFTSTVDEEESVVIHHSFLSEMANILLLPSLIILKSKQPIYLNNHKEEEETSLTAQLALQSMYCKCMEGAANVMSSFFDATLHNNRQQRQKNNSLTQQFQHDANPTIVLQCLITCATAVPCSYETTAATTTDHPNNNRQSETTLEPVTYALIHAVSSLLNVSKSTLGSRIATEMDGTLLARLAQICLDAATNNSRKEVVRTTTNTTTLHAIQTLQLLLQVTPFPKSWQRLFPGCFSGLFRVAISQLHSRTNVSTKVATAAILTLSILLDLTLVDDEHITIFLQKREQESVEDISIGEHGDTTRICSSSKYKFFNQEEDQEQLFSKQVNERLPAPLTILLYLSTSSSSNPSSTAAIRIAGIRIIRNILLSPILYWRKRIEIKPARKVFLQDDGILTNISPLETTALECCMRLLNDHDYPRVQTEARRTIYLYQSYLGIPQWRELLSRSMYPRLLALIEELPTVAQRVGQETECINHMNLICGYLTVGSTKNNSANEDAEKDSDDANQDCSSSIIVALTSPGGLEVVRNAIGEMFEPDLDVIDKTQCSVVVSPFADNDLQSTSDSSSLSTLETADNITLSYSALHLRSHRATVIAIKMARLLGASLGPVGCAKFIHKCMIDMQGELMMKAELSKHGKGQANMVKRMIGVLVLVNEICVGGFSHSIPTATEEVKSKEKKFKPSDPTFSLHARRSAFQLFRSLVPIVFRTPIWDLPTSLVETRLALADARAVNDAACVQYFSHRRSKSYGINLKPKNASRFVPEVPSRTLHANAVFVSEVIKLTCNLVDVMGEDVNIFLPDMLFPILEKTNSLGNHPIVQQAALQALINLSLATSNKKISFLLAENLDYIADAALSRIRPTGGRRVVKKSMPPRLPGVIEVVLRFCTYSLEETKKSNLSTETGKLCLNPFDPLLLRSKVCQIIDVVGALTEAFDQNCGGFGADALDSDRFLAESVIRMFESTVAYLYSALDTCRSFDKDVDSTNENGSSSTTSVWLNQLLVEFGIQSKLDSTNKEVDDENSILSPEAGFNKHHAERKEYDSELEKEQKEEIADQSNSLQFPLEIVLRIMFRCSFLLSFPDLVIQKSSVLVLQKCVHCLDFADSDGKKSKISYDPKVSEFRRNELLPSINKIWPAVLARLRFAVDKIYEARETHSFVKFNARRMLSSPTEEPKIAAGYSLSSLPFFLESLMDLVATLSEVSGDFMKSRFEHDTWPLISKLLGSHAKRLSSVSANLSIEKVCTIDLASMLACIRRVYFSRDSGVCLAHIIPVISIIVLPFIQYPGRVGEEAVGAIEAMMRIDRCCLFRELHKVCGLRWAPNPLDAPNHSKNVATSIINTTIIETESADTLGLIHERDTTMVKRARHLITFSSQLDEQLLY